MISAELLDKVAAEFKADPFIKDPRWPPSDYYRFLGRLCKEADIHLAVELGVCGGGSGMYMADRNPGTTVVAIDNQWDHPENIEAIRENYINYHFWIGDSIRAVDQVWMRFGEPELLFIDTVHTKERAMDEFTAWKKALKPSAVVVFDDLFRKEMDGLWEALPGDKRRYDKIHDGSPGNDGGFGVIWNFK